MGTRQPSRRTFMQHTKARVLAFLALGAALHVAQTAEARLPPDVLLLVDTSGSMAYTSVRDPSNPARYALPKCAAWPGTTNVDFSATDLSGTATPPDRWAMLVKVLTGTVHGMQCSSQTRSTVDFKNEFKLGGTTYGTGSDPADADYYLPFNRIVASSGATACTPAPSWDPTIRQALLDDAMSWPTTSTTGPIFWRTVGPYASSSVCPFDPQEPDGIMDAYESLVRFGFMTFDPNPNWSDNGTIRVGTGIVTGTSQASYPAGIADTWSYFPGWRTDGTYASAATGWPGGCDSGTGQVTQLLEVGVRNPAAPPWEGRLIGFGDPLADAAAITTNNARVQAALAVMRPYGGTPIAGMLEDARYFLLGDNTTVKNAANQDEFWGGAVDPAISTDPNSDACRKRYVVLLTDGGPNLDLRPECAFTINTVAGKCPYPLPTQTAQILKNNNVPVYVIGFSVSSSSGSTQTCTNLTSNPNACSTLTNCTASTCGSGKCTYGYCVDTGNTDQELLATCCTIKGIADAGGGKAYFAEDASGLHTAFAQILKDVVQPPVAPSQPVFSSASAQYSGSNSDAFQGAQFLSAHHNAPYLGDLGIGDLDRQRIKCELTPPNGPLEAKDQTVDATKGDKYQVVLDAHKAERKVYTVIGAVDVNGKIWSQRSIRPFYTDDAAGDHLGLYGISQGDPETKMITAAASAFPTLGQLDSRAMIDTGSAECAGGKCCFAITSTPDQCREYYMKLEFGEKAGPAEITFQRSSVFGAVLRTPLLVNTPSAFLRDDSYTAFQKTFRARKPVLYAATADGQLHAFMIDKTNTELSEYWTFIPPAMLPAITEQFRNRATASGLNLMNGVLVARDVAGAVDWPPNNRFLTRTRAQAKGGAGATRWYTILVGSYGDRPGFFALDVSWPDPDTAHPAPSGYVQGPRFLWQLTTDSNGSPLFGNHASRPSIATLYFKMPGDINAAEHAVAILPGGRGGEATAAMAPAQFKLKPGYDQVLDSRFTVRGTTPVYTQGSDPSPLTLEGARSITIVRLDTGEVVRTFRAGDPTVAPAPTDNRAPAGLYGTTPLRIANAGFDAPIVGEVVTYPGSAGAVADRAYFGDAQGRLWRLDLSSQNPADWNASMILDAYPTAGFNNDYTASDARPIETPPIISSDSLGRITVAVSTGSQDVLTTDGKHPVWSLTETLSGGKYVSRVNWFLNEKNSIQKQGETELHFSGGERVRGPMTLFSGILYFTSQRPPASGLVQCSDGQAYLWAVHYINAGLTPGLPSPSATPEDGPMPAHSPTFQTDVNTTPNMLDPGLVRYLSLGADSAAFGVGIRQRPSCYQTDAGGDDPFLGFGSHTSISSITPGNFQLVVQTGGAGSTSGDSSIRTMVETLAPPAGGVTIDSWAAILE